MKKNPVLFFGMLMVFSLACNLASSAPATQVNLPVTAPPATEVIPPPTDVPAFSGISISAKGTSFVIPQNTAGGAVLNVVPASTANSSDLPYWDIYPEYLQFDLSGYALQGLFHQPRLLVYPAVEYAQQSEGAAIVIHDLQSVLANPSALPSNLPFLPLFNAGQVFHANEKILQFQNGSGIRFLTQYGQAPYPANNRDLFYTFQGITSDGAYYVSAILPINIGFLPPNGDPGTPLPPNGVPFDWDNFENLQAHFQIVTQKLNDAVPAEFLPDLNALDALIQSLVIGIE